MIPNKDVYNNLVLLSAKCRLYYFFIASKWNLPKLFRKCKIKKLLKQNELLNKYKLFKSCRYLLQP